MAEIVTTFLHNTTYLGQQAVLASVRLIGYNCFLALIHGGNIVSHLVWLSTGLVMQEQG